LPSLTFVDLRRHSEPFPCTSSHPAHRLRIVRASSFPPFPALSPQLRSVKAVPNFQTARSQLRRKPRLVSVSLASSPSYSPCPWQVPSDSSEWSDIRVANIVQHPFHCRHLVLIRICQCAGPLFLENLNAINAFLCDLKYPKLPASATSRPLCTPGQTPASPARHHAHRRRDIPARCPASACSASHSQRRAARVLRGTQQRAVCTRLARRRPMQVEDVPVRSVSVILAPGEWSSPFWRYYPRIILPNDLAAADGRARVVVGWGVRVRCTAS
jgi:hypothetical protein